MFPALDVERRSNFLRTISGEGANPVEPALPILKSILDVSSGVPMLNSVWETFRRSKEKRRDFFRDRIASEMRKVFGKDRKRINHANRVVRFAEEIFHGEGGDPTVVIAASYLHDIGIREAERKYNSTAGNYQELEGPPIARNILEKIGADREMIDEVCDLIAHHHSPGHIQTLNFQILWEADSLVNLEEATGKEQEKINEVVEVNFKTSTGRDLAKALLLDKVNNHA